MILRRVLPIRTRRRHLSTEMCIVMAYLKSKSKQISDGRYKEEKSNVMNGERRKIDPGMAAAADIYGNKRFIHKPWTNWNGNLGLKGRRRSESFLSTDQNGNMSKGNKIARSGKRSKLIFDAFTSFKHKVFWKNNACRK